MCLVRICKNGEIREFKADPGTNLLDFLRDKSFDIPSVCGGKGTCGKCRVKVKGIQDLPTGKEESLLGNQALSDGYRLACYNSIKSDIDIFIEENTYNSEAKIVTSGLERDVKLNPVMLKEYIELPEPNISDQRSDVERLIDTLGGKYKISSLPLIRDIPELTRKQQYKITIVRDGEEITGIEAGDTTGKFYGIAVDIGTTTIVSYLYNLNNGEKIDTISTLNPQRKYGADVLSRIDYASQSAESRNKMHREIIDCINDIINNFSRKNVIDSDDIYTAVFVGNTTMMHFLMNLPARNIAVSPFIPVTTGIYRIRPYELDIKMNKGGTLIIFPSLSAYIGADIIAGLLSAQMNESEEISLLIDIGTNGEIVLGNRYNLYSCSTAAGPAFEGANIRNGTGGVSGAIDRVYFRDKLAYTTIGNVKPIGICGSGVVDAVAGMLDKGIMDETGRIADRDEVDGLDDDYIERLATIDGLNSFILAKTEGNHSFSEIAITQKDVRELQNAKAAIAAGIKVLIMKSGISFDDVKNVYLAGGFGNYINIESALKIGLIPRELSNKKITSIGNAAGAGAILGLLSSEMIKEADRIRKKAKYIELSSTKEFVDEYVNSMFF